MKRFWQEKNLKNWYTKIMSRCHLYKTKKTSKSSERHFTHVSLFNLSENLCNTCCLSFFLLIWTIKLLMYETTKLFIGDELLIATPTESVFGDPRRSLVLGLPPSISDNSRTFAIIIVEIFVLHHSYYI
jgi:hypothetical protein